MLKKFKRYIKKKNEPKFLNLWPYELNGDPKPETEVSQEHIDITDELVELHGKEILSFAVYFFVDDILQAIINHRHIDIHEIDEEGVNVFWHACNASNLNAMQILMSKMMNNGVFE